VESLEQAVVVPHISRKTSEMWATQVLLRVGENPKKKPQTSPLRYAPVEMTILFEGRIPRFQEKYEILAATELSSRPERSVVERSAVSFWFSHTLFVTPSRFPETFPLNKFWGSPNVSRATLSKPRSREEGNCRW
jgi:hypothetical protein